MFSRSKRAPKAAPRTSKAGPPGLSFIGSEVVISGDIATTAQLHVDGRVDGSVRCAQLCQGASGVVAGDIVADEARIAGQVEGTVSGKTVVLESSARVSGDISYETITIAARGPPALVRSCRGRSRGSARCRGGLVPHALVPGSGPARRFRRRRL